MKKSLMSYLLKLKEAQNIRTDLIKQAETDALEIKEKIKSC